MAEEWDLIIVGAGPAGLTAGIYGARSGLKTLILDEKQAGGALTIIPWIENYPGFSRKISGEKLAREMISQCVRFGKPMLRNSLIEGLKFYGILT